MNTLTKEQVLELLSQVDRIFDMDSCIHNPLHTNTENEFSLLTERAEKVQKLCEESVSYTDIPESIAAKDFFTSIVKLHSECIDAQKRHTTCSLLQLVPKHGASSNNLLSCVRMSLDSLLEEFRKNTFESQVPAIMQS